jgi:acetyl-CoA carboxylase beta subunit
MINNIQDLVNEVLWKPSFEWGDKKGEYERRWFYEHNKEIHGNLKQVINCKYCNNMKTSGGFTYFIDNEEIKDFDTWEKKINKLEIKETIVKGLEVYARTK